MITVAPKTARLEKCFENLHAQGRAGLITFVTAGDPNPQCGLEIMKGLPDAGADVIELGMPFTDPMADGPSIQAAGLRALDKLCAGLWIWCVAFVVIIKLLQSF